MKKICFILMTSLLCYLPASYAQQEHNFTDVQTTSSNWKDLYSFTDGKEIVVYWGVSSECSAIQFELYYSTDLNNWELVEVLDVEEFEKHQNSYFLTHTLPHEGYNHYRVKLIEGDGTAIYSAVTSVYIEKMEIVKKLFPNPNNGSFYVELDSGNEYVESFTIRDMHGERILFNKHQQNDLYSFRLENWDDGGVYTLKIVTDKRVYDSKFIVR